MLKNPCGSEYNLSFFKKPVGITMVIAVVFSFFSWVLMSAWVNETPREYNQAVDGEVAFFLIISLVTFIVYITALVVHTRGFRGPVIMLVLCFALGLVFIIASGLIYWKAKKHKCSIWKCRLLDTTAAFGFLCTIVLEIEAFIHFREWNSQPKNVATMDSQA